jgi:hypothetical protein
MKEATQDGDRDVLKRRRWLGTVGLLKRRQRLGSVRS